MGTKRNIFGRLPIYKGDWVEGVVVKEKFRFTYRGSEFQALSDGLTTAPLDNNDNVNDGWKVISNGTAAYKADTRISALETKKVSTDDIELSAVTSSKIAENAITTSKIADGAVQSNDINETAFDDTLSTSRKLADAKIVGNKFTEQESKLTELIFDVSTELGILYKGSPETPVATDIILFTSDNVKSGDRVYIKVNNITGGEVGIGLFDSNDTRLAIALRSIKQEQIDRSFVIPSNFSYAKVLWNDTALGIEYIGLLKHENKYYKEVFDKIDESTNFIANFNGNLFSYGRLIDSFVINSAGSYSLFVESDEPLVNLLSVVLCKGDIDQSSNRLVTLFRNIETGKYNKSFEITEEDIALGNGNVLYIGLYGDVNPGNTLNGIPFKASLYKNNGIITYNSLDEQTAIKHITAQKDYNTISPFGWGTGGQYIQKFFPTGNGTSVSMRNIQATNNVKSIKLSQDAISENIFFEVILWGNDKSVIRRYRNTSYIFTDEDRAYPYFVCMFVKYVDGTFENISVSDVVGRYYVEAENSSVIGYNPITPINTSGYNVEIFNKGQVNEDDLLSVKFSTSGTGAIGLFDVTNTRLSYFGVDNGEAGEVQFIVKIPTGFSVAKSIWGSITDVKIENISNATGVTKDIYKINDYLISNDVHIQDYFVEEMEATIKSVEQKVNAPCLVMNIVTDSHLNLDASAYSRVYQSVSNIRHFNAKVYTDGVVHLGDTVDLSMGNKYSDDVIYAEISKYLNTLALANKNFFPVNGNHDGEAANAFKEKRWYGDALRGVHNYAVQEGTNAFYYKDFDRVNTRCIFLSWPDSIDDTTHWSITERQLLWLIETLNNVKNNTHVIIFCHTMPCDIGQTDIEGILNAFSQHSNYSNGNISCDFSQQEGTKLVAWVNGHYHRDFVANSGWSFTDSKGKIRSNNLHCPVISIGAALLIDESVDWGDTPSRTNSKKSQDLWDTMIYRPDLNKIYMVRFGAGEDREIDV